MKQNVSPTQKVLNVWAIVLIVWSIYRAKFLTTLPIWFDEFVAKPIVFLVPVWHYITRVEKRPFFPGIDLKLKTPSKDLMMGFFIGMIFFLSGAVSYYLKHHTLIAPTVMSPQFLILVAVSVATSISEEIVSRGFVLKRLYEESKNIYSSSFLASVLFFFLHIPILFTNPNIIGFMLLRVMITDMILSLAISFIYLQRRNILIPIVIHALYNLSIYMFT